MRVCNRSPVTACSVVGAALVAVISVLFAGDVRAQPTAAESPGALSAGLVAAGIQLNWEAPRERADSVGRVAQVRL